MTREEAIKILNEIIDEGWLISDFDKCIAIDACEMAIKALKKESCEDCVSRKAILKEIPVLWNSNGDKNYCIETLRDFVAELPTVTPTQCIAKFTFDKDDLQEIVDKKVKELVLTPNWIPISERQPKENGNYLAFYCTNDGTSNLEFMMVDHCNAGGGWLHEKNGRKAYTKVIAWMPLPEPYKKSEVFNEQDRE